MELAVAYHTRFPHAFRTLNIDVFFSSLYRSLSMYVTLLLLYQLGGLRTRFDRGRVLHDRDSLDAQMRQMHRCPTNRAPRLPNALFATVWSALDGVHMGG